MFAASVDDIFHGSRNALQAAMTVIAIKNVMRTKKNSWSIKTTEQNENESSYTWSRNREQHYHNNAPAYSLIA